MWFALFIGQRVEHFQHFQLALVGGLSDFVQSNLLLYHFFSQFIKGRFINLLKRTGFSLNLKLTDFVLYNSLGLTVNALADFFAVDFKINLSGVTVSAIYKVNRAVTEPFLSEC